MTPLTLQEVFTAAVIGFREQNYQRSVQGGTCMYRTPQGLRCLVGMAIPDDKYDPKWDSRGKGGGIASCWSDPNFAGLFDTTRSALRDLQWIHDRGGEFSHLSHADQVAEYEYRFRQYAAQYSLVYPEIQT